MATAITTRAGVVCALGVAALLVPAQPVLAGKAKQARPDLVVVDGGMDDFAIPGEENVVRFTDETENRGYRAASPSRTGVSFSAPKPLADEYSHPGFTRPVRKLKGFVGDSSEKTSRSPKLEFERLPVGAYRVTICADVRDEVKERNEKNNCIVARDSRLFVARRTWQGSLSGTYLRGSGDLRDTWSSADAVLRLADYEGFGRFSYNFEGTVTWVTSGTDAAGCSWSGTGTQAFSGGSEPGDVFVNMEEDEYSGSLAATDIEYPTSAQCPTGPRTGLGPDSNVFLSTTGEGSRDPDPFPFGTDALRGTSSSGSSTTWSWDFR